MVVAHLLRDTGAVVKGGRNLEIRYGLRSSRASSDLDVVRAASLEAFTDDLEDALATGWNGFTGTVRDRGAIAAPVPDGYVPHRLDAKLAYNGRSGVGTVSVEVAVEEAGGLAAVESATSHDAHDLFSAIGLLGPDPVLRDGWEPLYDRELATLAGPRVALADDVHAAASWANELIANVDAAR